MGERVRRGEENAVELAEEDAGADTGSGSVRVEETAGDLAGLEGSELGGCRGLGELKADAGMAAVKLANDWREHGGHGEAGKRDAHVADLAAGEGLKVGGNRRDGAENGLETFEQQFAGGRDLDTAARAIEKIGIERGFELGDGAAEGGLRDHQRLGRFAKMELPRDLAEVNEVTELERELILARHGVWGLESRLGV